MIEKLIEKKKEEVIANVKEEVKELENKIIEEAKAKFMRFAEELKTAYESKVVGPEDLLRAIEKGGLVWREIVDMEKVEGSYAEDILKYIDWVAGLGNLHRRFSGKQRVTIIIEPLEKK